MKKCEFCGKQISYFDQYCDDECHIKANKFYEKGERFGKLFAVINMICVFGIPIGLFMLSFARGRSYRRTCKLCNSRNYAHYSSVSHGKYDFKIQNSESRKNHKNDRRCGNFPGSADFAPCIVN